MYKTEREILKAVAPHYDLFINLTACLYNAYMTGKGEFDGGYITSEELIADPCEATDAAITGAMMSVLGFEDKTVRADIDALARANEYLKIVYSAYKLALNDLITLDFRNKDEYGFPCIRLDERQKKMMEKRITT